jgi:hypothetical protein
VSGHDGGGPQTPALRCRVCAAEVPAGAARCGGCGAAFGTLAPCPCCRAEAGASPHAELRFACDVCGGPRVPQLDRSIQYSGREAALLRKADAARKARAGWRALAIGVGLLLFILLVAFAALLLLLGPGATLFLTALVMGAPIAVFVAVAARRAGASGREITPALDAAWLSAATDVARQTPGLTAPTLAQKLGVEEAQAEELMALLDVDAALAMETPKPPARPITSAPTRPPSRPAPPITGPRLRVGADEAALAEQEDEAALAERIEATASAGVARNVKP